MSSPTLAALTSVAQKNLGFSTYFNSGLLDLLDDGCFVSKNVFSIRILHLFQRAQTTKHRTLKMLKTWVTSNHFSSTTVLPETGFQV